jgi:hypothetical protein
VSIIVPKHSILEANLRGASRDVVKPKLDRSRIAEGILGISWRIMEHSDGFSLQVIYAGPADAELRVEGTLKGQPKIEPIVKYVSTLTYLPLIVWNILVCTACWIFTKRAMLGPPGRKRKVALALLIIVLIASGPVAVWIYKRGIIAPLNLTSWKGDVDRGVGSDF